MKKLLLWLLCFGSMSGLIVNVAFCQSIEDILNSSSQDSQESITDESEGSAPSNATAPQPSEPDKKDDKDYFSLQIGTFKTQGAADRQIIELTEKGYEPYIFQSLNSKNETIYAVRIGQYETYQSAMNELEDLRQKIDTPALVTHYDSLETAYAERQLASKSSETTEETGTASQTVDEEKAEAVSESMAGSEIQDRISRLEGEIERLKEASDVRSELQMTEEEAREEEEDILEAAGREYTLTKAGNIKFTYGFGYTYSEYNAIKESVRVEDVSNHTIRNSLNVSYGLKDNLTLSTGIPFVYKYHRIGTDESKEENDLGDLSLNWKLQPIKTNRDLPTIIVNGSFNIPVGRSPYEIDPGEELSTSSGLYSTDLGVSISQVSDPVVVFASLSTSYALPVEDIGQKRNEGILEEVDPGIGFGIGMGMGYALSYKLNFNLSISYSYSFEYKYRYRNAPTAETGTSASASMKLGAGYRLSRTQNLNLNFGIPITNTGSFSFSFSTPIEFEL